MNFLVLFWRRVFANGGSVNPSSLADCELSLSGPWMLGWEGGGHRCSIVGTFLADVRQMASGAQEMKKGERIRKQ